MGKFTDRFTRRGQIRHANCDHRTERQPVMLESPIGRPGADPLLWRLETDIEYRTRVKAQYGADQ